MLHGRSNYLEHSEGSVFLLDLCSNASIMSRIRKHHKTNIEVLNSVPYPQQKEQDWNAGKPHLDSVELSVMLATYKTSTNI